MTDNKLRMPKAHIAFGKVSYIFFKSPPLKLLGQINRSMTGSIYGISSMKIAHIVLIG
jgi:predicted DNA-binding transcriptional regulator